MKWLEIPIEELKEFDKDWETRRRSVDGTKALLHEETFNELFPPVMTLDETEDEELNTPIEYPFPVLDYEEISGSPEWNDPT